MDFLHLLMICMAVPGQQLDKRHLISPIFRHSGISRSSSCCFSTCLPETIRNEGNKIRYSICLLRMACVLCDCSCRSIERYKACI